MTWPGAIRSNSATWLIAVLLSSVALVGIQVGAIGPLIGGGALRGAVPQPEAGRQTQLDGSEVTSVRLSADTVGLGDVFELSVGIRVPPGRAVFFPDSMEARDGLESFRPVRWESRPVEGRGADLTLTYPLMAFTVGMVSVPAFEVVVGPAEVDATGGVEAEQRLPGGSVVGSWSDVYGAPGVDESWTRMLVPDQRVWVASVLLLEDIAAGLEPRPAADVVGSSWDWVTVSALFFVTTLLAGVATTLVRRSLAGRRAAREAAASEAARSERSRLQEALDELDLLFGLGLHSDGMMKEFYQRSSGVVRTYVESLNGAWGPSLTSTELMDELKQERNGGAAPDLLSAMKSAEVVKFGRLRPDREAAELHWGALREWVLDSERSEP